MVSPEKCQVRNLRSRSRPSLMEPSLSFTMKSEPAVPSGFSSTFRRGKRLLPPVFSTTRSTSSELVMSAT